MTVSLWLWEAGALGRPMDRQGRGDQWTVSWVSMQLSRAGLFPWLPACPAAVVQPLNVSDVRIHPPPYHRQSHA